MNDSLYLLLTIGSAIGCGLVGGIFFAFSTFIMKGLKRLPAAGGIAAMQSINITVINPMFMTAFFGTAAACAVLIVHSLMTSIRHGGYPALAGSLIYLFGTILVTIAFNVPRNDALAKVDPESEEGARIWAIYVREWTAWNHVRTVAALASSALLIIGLDR